MFQPDVTPGKAGAQSTPRKPALLPILMSGLVTMLGLVIMSGWLLQIRAMVEGRSGLVAMVFNTALCFTLAGSAVLLPALARRPTPVLQNLVGAAIFALSALILGETTFDLDLGLDWAYLHRWLRDGNVYPGRMAPNTAIGFMLAGVCLMLLSRIASKAQERLYQLLILCVAAIGLTGLVGYAIAPDQLFGWTHTVRMALHTSVGMVALAVALWSSRYRLQRGAGAKYLGLGERIGFMSAAILTVSMLTAGLTGFLFHQAIPENSWREKLYYKLEGHRRVITTILTEARAATSHVRGDRRLLAHALALSASNSKDVDRIVLDADMRDLLGSGFYGIALYTLDGRLLYQAGAKAPLPGAHALALPERDKETAWLSWEDQIILDTSAPLLSDGVPFARLALRRRLPILELQLVDLHSLGKTGEIVLCAGKPTTLACLPSGRQLANYTISRINIAGLPLPMSHAVDGRQGLAATLDYKGNNVMAAYAPLAPNLGLVVKQDTRELYSAVRTQLKVVVPVLLLLLLGAVMLMRLQLRPLVARLVDSEREANDKQMEVNALLASVGEGIMTMDERGTIESFNQAAAAIFGYAPEEVLGKRMLMLLPPEIRQSHKNGLRQYLNTGEANVIGMPNVELPGLRKDGSRFTLELSINEIRYATRRRFVGIARDISERKRVEAKLIYLAQTDALTGLPNRALFMDRLAGATLRANRAKSALAVLFLDLDGFKKVNDTLGHHSGDQLLKKFGERISQSVRKSDTVARLAGDEFTIILEELSDPEADTCAVADKIIEAMHLPFELADGSVSVTTSIGIAMHAGSDLANVTELLRRADDAMYRAKFSGKNRWSV